MYKCDVCNEFTTPGTKQNRIPADTRPKVYPPRYKANKVRKGGKKPILRDDPGGAGFETVTEVVACPSCHRRYLETVAAEPREEARSAA